MRLRQLRHNICLALFAAGKGSIMPRGESFYSKTKGVYSSLRYLYLHARLHGHRYGCRQHCQRSLQLAHCTMTDQGTILGDAKTSKRLFVITKGTHDHALLQDGCPQRSLGMRHLVVYSHWLPLSVPTCRGNQKLPSTSSPFTVSGISNLQSWRRKKLVGQCSANLVSGEEKMRKLQSDRVRMNRER